MILFADSGSTKTRWILIDNNTIKDKISSAGLNIYYQSTAEIEKEIGNIRKKIGDTPINELYFFGTGINTEEGKKKLEDCFKKVFSPNIQCHLFSDIYAAGMALFPEDSGIACILGTGSNSAYFESKELKQQIPPLGFWLGDEGSGGHLGKQLILSYLHRQMPDEIRANFESQYGKLDRIDVLNMAYKTEFPNRAFAAYAPFLKIHENNPFIEKLIKNSFQLFFELYLLKYDKVSEKKIGFVGSIAFNFKEQLLEISAFNKLNLSKIIKDPIEEITNNFIK